LKLCGGQSIEIRARHALPGLDAAARVDVAYVERGEPVHRSIEIAAYVREQLERKCDPVEEPQALAGKERRSSVQFRDVEWRQVWRDRIAAKAPYVRCSHLLGPILDARIDCHEQL